MTNPRSHSRCANVVSRPARYAAASPAGLPARPREVTSRRCGAVGAMAVLLARTARLGFGGRALSCASRGIG